MIWALKKIYNYRCLVTVETKRPETDFKKLEASELTSSLTSTVLVFSHFMGFVKINNHHR